MQIPSTWKQLLADIQKVAPEAVLAGGALRDLDHGLPAKDLDVFIAAGSGNEAEGLNELMGGHPMTDPEIQMYPDNMPEIQLVADHDPEREKFNNLTGLPLQFIYINWQTHNIIKRFDYGLCQIMYDGRELRTSEQYDTDKQEKTMTLLRCDNEFALGRSVERFARWKPRYPDHRFVLGCRLDLGSEKDVDTIAFCP
jgi:hypothetical protein